MDIEERVLRLVSEELSIKLSKLKLSDRLRVDLGMDGTDAVEFFESFAAGFNVDCAELQDRWGDYFGPEAAPWLPGANAIFLAGSVVLAILIAVLFPRLHFWTVCLLVLGIWIVVLSAWAQLNTVRERKNPTSQQITIAQLIEAATTKRLIL
jgi:hypothetical protein